MISLLLGRTLSSEFTAKDPLPFSRLSDRLFLQCGAYFFPILHCRQPRIESVPRFHDWAGIIELGICFFALWGCVHLICGNSLKLTSPRSSFAATNQGPRLFPQKLAISLAVCWPSLFSALKPGIRLMRAGSCSSGLSNCPSQSQNSKPCLFPICLETNRVRLPGLKMTEAVGLRSFLNGPPARPAPEFWLGFTVRRIVSLPSGIGYKPTEALSRSEPKT
jgi:hypothetical protein